MSFYFTNKHYIKKINPFCATWTRETAKFPHPVRHRDELVGAERTRIDGAAATSQLYAVCTLIILEAQPMVGR